MHSKVEETTTSEIRHTIQLGKKSSIIKKKIPRNKTRTLFQIGKNALAFRMLLRIGISKLSCKKFNVKQQFKENRTNMRPTHIARALLCRQRAKTVLIPRCGHFLIKALHNYSNNPLSFFKFKTIKTTVIPAAPTHPG
jgi:hypothetical protein